ESFAFLEHRANEYFRMTQSLGWHTDQFTTDLLFRDFTSRYQQIAEDLLFSFTGVPDSPDAAAAFVRERGVFDSYFRSANDFKPARTVEFRLSSGSTPPP